MMTTRKERKVEMRELLRRYNHVVKIIEREKIETKAAKMSLSVFGGYAPTVRVLMIIGLEVVGLIVLISYLALEDPNMWICGTLGVIMIFGCGFGATLCFTFRADDYIAYREKDLKWMSNKLDRTQSQLTAILKFRKENAELLKNFNELIPLMWDKLRARLEIRYSLENGIQAYFYRFEREAAIIYDVNEEVYQRLVSVMTQEEKRREKS